MVDLLSIRRQNHKLGNAYICARAHFKAKMNENDENVVPMRDTAPDVEHLRLEISENGEVFYRIDDVTKVPTTSSCFFFVGKREEEKPKEVFCFFKEVLFEAAPLLVFLSK